MARKFCFLLVFLLCCYFKYANSGSVLCESGFCRNYRAETGCTPTRADCGINNATHTGIWMLSPTICNCCQFCLPFIMENAHCSVGGPGLGTTVGRCGHGLTCENQDDGIAVCNRMETECHKAQDDYDARHLLGQTGALEERPVCDGKGLYAPYSCVPTQSCFCQSTEGKRIFGEALYLGSATIANMNCGCSRLHDKISKIIQPGVPYPVVGARCTSDGNFHPIQCMKRICYCVDPITGQIRDGPHRRIDLDTQPLTSLECYDPELDMHPEQSQGTRPFNYTTPCFESMEERMELLEESREAGFNVDFYSTVPSCLPDGTFGRIGMTRNRTRICVDQRGVRIGDYEAFPDTAEYDNMDCKCAYTSHVVMASQLERPVCCSNGNFRRIQCRRGMCRCVDTDGRQTEKENADPSALSCFTQNWREC